MSINSAGYIVRRAFSNSAAQYEKFAALQYRIGHRLIDDFLSVPVKGHVLDVGMGSGRLTNRLSEVCPDIKIVGIDFASGMVFEAKEKYKTFEPLIADAQALPFAAESFDGVISNVAYQWVEDLSSAFAQVTRVLKKEGRFCASLFGRETLCELFDALENAKSFGPQKKDFVRLKDKDAVGKALIGAGLSDVKLDCRIHKAYFADIHSLFFWLKAIGANRLNSAVRLNPRILAEACEYYENHFKWGSGIMASFEVISVKGKK